MDMENLIPQRAPLEDMEDAFVGDAEAMPHKTLRRRYPQMPLMIMPRYQGDFLERRKEIFPDRSPDRTAADPTNLQDFSRPDEWLKHQEQPYPREILDWFYERNKPSDDNDTLKQWDDRAWEPWEAPEWSEDVVMRLRNIPKERLPQTFKLPSERPAKVAMAFIDRFRAPEPSAVVASFLLRHSHTITIPLSQSMPRTAMTLDILNNSKIKGQVIKNRGDMRNPANVRAFPDPGRSNPGQGLWAFRTTSGRSTYQTYFQFVPEEGTNEVKNLKVRVTCTCPSWLWWGGLFNAISGQGRDAGEPYLYGPIRFPIVPTGTRTIVKDPSVRDPSHEFVACKHMIRCIEWLESNRLEPPSAEAEVPPAERVEVELRPGVDIEELRIPSYLVNVKSQNPVRGILRQWKDMSIEDRDTFIKSLDSPAHLLYMGYRFPSTAAYTVLDQLERKKFPPGFKSRIDKAKRDFQRVLQQVRRFKQQHGERMAADENTWDEGDLGKKWLGMSEDSRKKYVSGLTDPADVYSIFLMFPKHSLELVIGKLRELLKDSQHKKMAEEYLRDLLP